jgi:hypothetical protein
LRCVYSHVKPTWIALLAPLGLGLASSTRAQSVRSALTATSNVEPGSAIGDDAVIEFALSRPLAPDEGELALVVGGLDVTAVAERTPSRIVYRPRTIGLGAGATELVLFRRRGNRWSEIRRVAMTVVQAAGGVASIDRSASLGNTGQVAEGHSSDIAAPTRRTFQDFVMNGGLHSSVEQGGVTFTTQSNYIGVTRREQALRFGTLADRAPMLDLSDYLVTLKRSNAMLSIGHVAFGASRHLANGFAARGGTFTVTQGATTMTIGALNSTAQVGWDNIVGLERPTDRVFGAAIGREIVASHPGALRLDVTVLDGAKSPVSSFTQGAVADATKSAGGTVQLTAALPNQRMQLTTGFTRSRFENPASDPQLLVDTLAIQRPRPVTRGARFADLSAVVLQNTQIPVVGPANVTVGFHDERVDPLFGSVAAQPQADHQQDAADAAISLGAVTAQASRSWGHDNLGNVASVLRTNSSATTANIAVPVARVLGAQLHAAWLPVVTAGVNRTHQLAAGMPTNGAFRAQDLPDQVSTNGDVAAQWQIGRVRASAHANRADQDNREDQRQNADFASGVTGVSLGRSIGAGGDVSIDAADEFQISKERGETTRTRRVTINGSTALVAALHLGVSISAVSTRPPTGASSVNGEQHIELSLPVRLWPGASGAERGQAFLRYARTSSVLPDPAVAPVASPVLVTREQWTIATGFTLRVF